MDKVTFGRYRLISLLGQGGMGKVYKAHDSVMDRQVAIKMLSPELAVRPNYQERFEREARAAGKLVEPHVIPVYEAGEIGGQLYLVMPVIDGEDVHALLRRDGPMDPARAVHIIEQLATALDSAHKADLVHRDVKPSNALIANQDFVYLIDFGIVHDAKGVKMTQTGMIMGTPAYMAPERFTAGVADARSDIYALACVLHECLTGKQPFPGDSLEQQLHAHTTLKPPKPCASRTDLPRAFNRVIAIGMAKKPAARYQTARQLADAARSALPTQSTRTKPKNTAATIPATQLRTLVERPPRRRRTRAILAVAAVALVAGVGISLYPDTNRHGPSSTSSAPRPSAAYAPPASAAPTFRQINYSITGYRGAGDTITVTYTDSSGMRHSQTGITLPWRVSLTMVSGKGSVQAVSQNRTSRLSCSITTSTGQVLSSNSSNAAQTSC